MADTLQTTIEFLQTYGYLSSRQVSAIDSWDCPPLKKAIAKYQRLDANVESFAAARSADLLPDGVTGPATAMAMSMPRCACKDVGRAVEQPAIGRGGWRGCVVGYEKYHVAVAKVTRSGMPSGWRENWRAILTHVQNMYAEIGLLWLYVDEDSKDMLTGEDRSDLPVNATLRWVQMSTAIGLASVGGVQSCRSHLPTFQLDPRYGRNFSRQTYIYQQAALLAHEHGHLASLMHIRGSVMNPGILDYSRRGPSWIGDPHESTLRRLFGGDPVPIPKPPTEPPPQPPIPPNDLKIGDSITPAFPVEGKPGNYVLTYVGGGS